MKKLLLLSIVLFASCKAHIVTNYKLTDSKGRSYYANSYEFTDNKDSIIVKEQKRDKTFRTFKLKYTELKITEK